MLTVKNSYDFTVTKHNDNYGGYSLKAGVHYLGVSDTEKVIITGNNNTIRTRFIIEENHLYHGAKVAFKRKNCNINLITNKFRLFLLQW